MKRHRIIRAAACILAAAFFFCAASCSGGKPDVPAASQTEPSQQPQTLSAVTEAAAAAEDVAFPDDETTVSQTEAASAETSAQATEPAPTTVPVQTTAPVQTTKPAPTTEPVQTTTVPAVTGHIHSYHTTTSEPTCTQRGYILKACECGDKQYTYTSEALGHDFGDYVLTKEASGTQEGERVRVCARCGLRETETIPKVRPYESMEAAQEMLRLINADRAKVGSAPLTFNYTCYPCAQIRAQEIITHYAHTRPNGKPFYSVVDEQGLDRSGGCAENLYNPTGSDVPPADGHAAFMQSEAHRTSLLNPLYTSVSICVLYTEDHTYYVELFFG